MPPAIGKPCATPGCSAIVTKGSRCEEHRHKVASDEYRDDRRRRGTAHERGYDAKWQHYRKDYLARNPLCVVCLTANRVTPANQIDHIRPRAIWPELFWESSNHQAICTKCHKRKTAAERDGLLYAAPMGLAKPLIQPTLIHGPPGSGKTTLAHQYAATDDIIIDLDIIKAELANLPMYRATESVTTEALAERNRRMARLDRTANKAWIIIASPTAQERWYWRELLAPARVYLLGPGQVTRQECKRRIEADGRRASIAYKFFPLVDGWFSAYEATAHAIESASV